MLLLHGKEIDTVKFVVSASFKRRGLRVYTDPVNITANKLTKKEQEYFINLILKYAKGKKKSKGRKTRSISSK